MPRPVTLFSLVLVAGCTEGTNGLGMLGEPDLGSFAPDAAGVSDTGLADTGPPDLGSVDTGHDAGSIDTGVILPVSYRISTGEAAYFPPRFNPAGESLTMTPVPGMNEATATFKLTFPFEVMGRRYPVGTDVSISNRGPIVFGSTGFGVGTNSSLLRPDLPGPMVVPFWGITPTSSFSIGLVRNSNYVDVTYRGVGLNVRFFVDGGRIEVMFIDADGTMGTPIGITDGQNVFAPQCSPTCAVRSGDVVTFYPENVQQDGSDVLPVSVVPQLPTNIAENEPLPISSFIFRNQGNRAKTQGGFAILVAPAGQRFSLPETVVLTQPFFNSLPAGRDVPMRYEPPQTFSLPGPGSYRIGLWIEEAEDLDRGNDLADLGIVNVGPPGLACNITTTEIPIAFVGEPYIALLTADGCPEPMWSVQSALPNGIGLVSRTGELFGRPSAPGRHVLTFTASQPGYAPDQLTIPFVVR